MNLEDRIRDAMTAHENEAPTAAEFRVRSATPVRRTRLLPAVAAASVVLAVAIAVVAIRWTGGDRHSPPASAVLTCPQKYVSSSNTAGVPGLWVPVKPRGVDGDSRLVPQQTPSHVVVCAYLHSDAPLPSPPHLTTHQPTLTGGKEVSGDLSSITSALTWLPHRLPGQSPFCRPNLPSTDLDAYLVGLSYPGGTIWVSAPGDHCGGASNGTFATTANLRAPVAAAYAAGRWTVGPSSTQSGDRDPCHVGTAGRLGQETAMVPGTPVSATICKLSSSNQSSATSSTVVRDFGPLAVALNSLPTQPSTSGCTGSGSQAVIYEALFRYSDGPPVFVRVLPNCHPSVDNGSVQGDDAGTVVPVIQNLLRRH